MPLAPGARFGPYEILAPLDAGGMGEVYRARDAKLARDYAGMIEVHMASGRATPLEDLQRTANYWSPVSRTLLCTTAAKNWLSVPVTDLRPQTIAGGKP